MQISRQLASLLLPLTAALLCQPSAGKAQTVAPVPAPTIITSAPYTISSPGYYQLGANLSYAGNGSTHDAIITINAANVTLDFGGHYISGPSATASTQLSGVYAYEKANLNIKNGTISHCYFGIFFDSNNTPTSANVNQHVDNMLILNGYFEGLYGQGISSSTVSNCRVSTIGGTTVVTYAAGVSLSGGSGNQVLNTTVTNVNATGGGATGISCTSNTLVTNCVVSHLTDTSNNAYGIFQPTVATGNTIINCYYGIDDADKYKDNVTDGCTVPFTGGTAVGANN